MIYQFGVLLLVGICMSITSAWPKCRHCTLEYNPICGTDLVTYANLCTFRCTSGKARIAYKGVCTPMLPGIPVVKKQPLPTCACLALVQPVCATNGHSYNNPCEMNCANKVIGDLQIAHLGRCVTKKREIDPQQVPSFTPVYKELAPLMVSPTE